MTPVNPAFALAYDSIYSAVQHNDVAGVQQWLEHDASLLNAQKDDQTIGEIIKGTPLHYAAYYQADDVMAFLLMLNADLTITDRFGHTPFYLSVFKGGSPSFRRLCDHVKQLVSEGRLDQHYFQDAPDDSVFHMAVSRANVEVMRELLPLFDPADPNQQRHSPLALAAKLNFLDLCELFLTYPSFKNPISLALKNKALRQAVSSGHLACAQLLLKHQADIHTQDSVGNGLISLALVRRTDTTDLILFLISQGASIHNRSSDGSTALHMATHQNPDMIPLLLAQGAQIDEQDNNGNTPLHVAIETAKSTVASTLIEAGANAYLKNHRHYSSFGYLAQKTGASLEMMKRMVETNPQIDLLEDALFNAMNIARQRRHDAIFDYLEEVHQALVEKRTLLGITSSSISSITSSNSPISSTADDFDSSSLASGSHFRKTL